MRHRVILFGVRRDLSWLDHDVLSPAMTGRVSVWQAISGLPLLRSRLSREPDSFESWFQVIREAPRSLKGWRSKTREKIEELMREAATRAAAHQSTGDRFVAGDMNTVRLQALLLKERYGIA
ncbi:hypothetical protein E4Q08_06215 [Candidatus Accumulibacter phosphatis]|uniref:Uncharacterized protein n=2 Tax=Candidatus Accumulibacter contiguus TaxID=2954381 RepID=A0ABX1T5H9_9PROT|nr:hypothetical protein [Candidatus Accumulibacter contiguus]